MYALTKHSIFVSVLHRRRRQQNVIYNKRRNKFTPPSESYNTAAQIYLSVRFVADKLAAKPSRSDHHPLSDLVRLDLLRPYPVFCILFVSFIFSVGQRTHPILVLDILFPCSFETRRHRPSNRARECRSWFVVLAVAIFLVIVFFLFLISLKENVVRLDSRHDVYSWALNGEGKDAKGIDA